MKTKGLAGLRGNASRGCECGRGRALFRIPRSLAEKIIPHIEVYDQRRRSDPRPLPQVVVAEAEGDAAAIGAAALTFNSYFFA